MGQQESSLATETPSNAGDSSKDAMTRIYANSAIRNIAQELASKYNVECCVISLADEDGVISKAACYSHNTQIMCKLLSLEDTELFKIIVKRDAPTIVADALKDPRLKNDALVKAFQPFKLCAGCGVRFLVELPLKNSKEQYMGTVCLVDKRPRARFEFVDAELLMTKGKDLVDVLRSLQFDSACSRRPSTQPLKPAVRTGPQKANREKPRLTDDSVLILNIGGHIFKVEKKYLENCASPVLAALFSKGPNEDVEYFLDRDGSHYQYVFSFLRDGGDSFSIPEDAVVRHELEHESRVLGLPDLTALIASHGSPTSLSDAGVALALQHLTLGSHVGAPVIDGADGTEYKGAPLPKNESERLSRLEGLNILCTGQNEARFCNATRIVAALIEVPIALISLAHRDTTWFKSKVGVDECFTNRSDTFCAHMLVPESPHEASMLVIENCAADPKFMNNPLVKGDAHFRFYAGSPLVTSDGLRLGALCVIDRVPRKISPALAQCLANFSTIVSQEIERDELKNYLVGTSEDLFDASIPISLDFAAGAQRGNRMRVALGEALLLVKARSDSMDWPVLYASESWSRATSINVLPATSLVGDVVASGPGLVSVTEGLTSCENPMLWDWLTLLPSEASKLALLLKDGWAHDDPKMFHITATMKRLSPSGEGFDHIRASCRFSAASIPLDMNAAVIRTVPAPDVHSRGSDTTLYSRTHCYYFVTLYFQDMEKKHMTESIQRAS
jgi:GAF domain-containing protein